MTMRAMQTTGIVLLSVVVVLGFVSLLAPTGEAFIKTGNGVTQTETYSLWGMDHERDDPATGTQTTERGWFDDALSGTGGITFLRTAPALFMVSFALAITALVLTAVPRTRETTLGGVFAAVAFLGGLLSLVLHGSGLALHANDFTGAPNAVQIGAGLAAYVVAVLVLFVAAILGMVRGRHEVVTTHMEHAQQTDAPERLMRCPECSHVEAVPLGLMPHCGSCGYSV